MVLNLFNTETFDGSHWAVALRTLSGRRLVCCGAGFRRLLKQNTAELKQWSTFSGWPTIRSIESAENPWAAHAARTGGGTLRR